MRNIKGIIRGVVGFNKIPDIDGDHFAEVEYELKPIDIRLLRQIFNVDQSSADPIVRDMINPLDINKDQAEFLQPYVIDGTIDTDKYKFELHCWQDPSYDWSKGFPVKIEDK
jgi:hypothetical protein